MHAKMPKFLGLGTLVKFAKSHPMHPKTPNVLPKHPNCRTCRTIRVSHKTAATVHLPCLLVLPTKAKFLMVPAIFLKNMVTYPPPNPHISEKPFSRPFQKGIAYPPHETRSNGKKANTGKNPSKPSMTPPPGFRTYI